MSDLTWKNWAVAALAIVVCVALAVVAGDTVQAEKVKSAWTQFGGPDQNFKVIDARVAKKWPEAGPKQLWKRDLGGGFSAVLAEDGKLYTMYRADDQEVVVCLNAKDGETIWEYRYDSGPNEGHIHQYGDGPRATPLISGDRIYTIGIAGVMHALDKQTGKSVWSHNLWEEFDGNFLNHGYSSSPIAYKNTIIALVGGEDQSIVAFNKKDGSVAWKNLTFPNSYSTPQILNVDGEDQLVTFMATALIGVDPDNGDLKWSYDHENQWGQNINMPVMVDKNNMFMSSPLAGARGLKLTNNGKTTDVEESWSTRKIQFYHVTSVRLGDYVYGTTGMQAPAFMSAVNIRTGEIAWRERGFAKANLIEADGRLIVLDEDGKLSLTTMTPEKLTIHSQVELLDSRAWTVPTIVGSTIFVRDETSIRALDIG